MKTAYLLLLATGLWVGGAWGEDLNPFSPYYPVWSARACLLWSDGLVVPEAQGRIKWARKCAPQYEAYYRFGEKQGTPDGMKGPLYPVYGVLDNDGNPANPRRYYAPVEPPAHDDECDLPPDYTLVGLCPGLPGK